MTTAKTRKLQCLLITELLEKGSIQLLLPDGIILDIGILHEDEFGEVKKTDDYCYVVATRDGKSTILDSFNLGLQFVPEKDTIVFEDETVDANGTTVRTLDIV